MYQDHLIIPRPGAFGPDIGHVISRDLVHWARLPVSIWNDKPYDENAIYTGSTTVIGGKPYIVYPGRCTIGGDFGGCTTSTNYAMAVPSDPGDPFYTNWTKDKTEGVLIATNPIVNGTSDDPSTAWRTPHGEWRLIGNAKAAGQKKDHVQPIFAASTLARPQAHISARGTVCSSRPTTVRLGRVSASRRFIPRGLEARRRHNPPLGGVPIALQATCSLPGHHATTERDTALARVQAR